MSSTASASRGPGSRSILVDFLVALFAILSLGILILESMVEMSPERHAALQSADFVIAIFFLLEWTIRFVLAESKWRFFKRYWWELIASIPLTTDVTQALRTLRTARIIRIVQLVRVVKVGVRLHILLRLVRNFSTNRQVVGLSTTVVIVVVFGALAFHFFEVDANPQVDSLWDSFWWAFITVTTVGYGDIYPYTTAGRIVAMILLVTGLGLLGTFTATIASAVARRAAHAVNDEDSNQEEQK